MLTKLCTTWLATTSLSCDGSPETLSSVNLFVHFFSCILHPFSFQKSSPKMMHVLCRTMHVTNSGIFFKCTSMIFNKILHLPLAFRMPTQCTCGWSFARSPNDIPPESTRPCVRYMEPTSTGGKSMQHPQSKHMGIASLPHKIALSQSVPTSLHRATNPPILCKNSKHFLDTTPCNNIE